MEEEHLLQLASDHYNQRLRRRGMKGLVYNVLEQRQLRLRAEHHFNKKTITKYFIKVNQLWKDAGITRCVWEMSADSITDESNLQREKEEETIGH